MIIKSMLRCRRCRQLRQSNVIVYELCMCLRTHSGLRKNTRIDLRRQHEHNNSVIHRRRYVHTTNRWFGDQRASVINSGEPHFRHASITYRTFSATYNL